MNKKIFLLMIWAFPFLLNAQSSDLGNWMIYFGNIKMKSDWNWHHDIQYRNYDLIGDLEQLLLRTGIGYNLTENNNNLLLGYGYIKSGVYPGDGAEKTDVNEHRIYQQFITRQKIGRLALQHRYRSEQRFVEDKFNMRFHYFLLLNFPLNNENMDPGTFYLSAYNEIFLSTESPVFDRNRIYAGAGYKFSDTVRAELGYLNQLFEKTSRDQLNMILFVNL